MRLCRHVMKEKSSINRNVHLFFFLQRFHSNFTIANWIYWEWKTLIDFTKLEISKPWWIFCNAFEFCCQFEGEIHIFKPAWNWDRCLFVFFPINIVVESISRKKNNQGSIINKWRRETNNDDEFYFSTAVISLKLDCLPASFFYSLLFLFLGFFFNV